MGIIPMTVFTMFCKRGKFPIFRKDSVKLESFQFLKKIQFRKTGKFPIFTKDSVKLESLQFLEKFRKTGKFSIFRKDSRKTGKSPNTLDLHC